MLNVENVEQQVVYGIILYIFIKTRETERERDRKTENKRVSLLDED